MELFTAEGIRRRLNSPKWQNCCEDACNTSLQLPGEEEREMEAAEREEENKTEQERERD